MMALIEGMAFTGHPRNKSVVLETLAKQFRMTDTVAVEGAYQDVATLVRLEEGRKPYVSLEGMRFQPDDLTVAPGDTIVWVNKDLVAHTATSERGGFDSKIIQPEQTWTFTIKKKGDFAYVCLLHPTMTAMLRVK